MTTNQRTKSIAEQLADMYDELRNVCDHDRRLREAIDEACHQLGLLGIGFRRDIPDHPLGRAFLALTRGAHEPETYSGTIFGIDFDVIRRLLHMSQQRACGPDILLDRLEKLEGACPSYLLIP